MNDENLLHDERPVSCYHNWIPVEHLEMPAGTGIIRNTTKLYCTECDEMKKVKY
jgi:hypothetical protein